MSTIKAKKSDGSEINFHLKLENGLPLKTMISPNHKYMINELNQKKVLAIYLNEEEYSQFNGFKLNQVNAFIEDANIFIEIDNLYVVIESVPDQFFKSLKEKNVSYAFFKANKGLINNFEMN